MSLRLVQNFVTPELIAVDHHVVHSGAYTDRNRAIVGRHGIVKPVVLDVFLAVRSKEVVVNKRDCFLVSPGECSYFLA